MAVRLTRLILMIGILIRIIRENVALEVRLNSPLQLTCDGNILAWEFLADGPKSTIIIQRPTGTNRNHYSCAGHFANDNQECRNGIKIDDRNGRNFMITTVKMEDAGMYICKSNRSPNQTNVTVVVDTAPSMQFYKKNADDTLTALNNEASPRDRVVVQCSTQYSGFIGQYLELVQRSLGGDEQSIISQSQSTIGEFALRQQFTIQADFIPDETEHDFDFICRLLSFPEFSWMKNIQRFHVYYGPQLVDDVAQVTEDLVGGFVVLDCSSNSYPPPIYTWLVVEKNSNRDLFGNLPIYRVEEAGEYLCEVFNSKLNRYASKRFYVHGTPDSKTASSKSSLNNQFMAGIAVSLSVVGGIVIIGAIAAVIIKHRRGRAGRQLQPRRAYTPGPTTISSTDIGITNDAYEMNDAPPLWEAPPSYEEATKDDTDMASSNAPS